MPDREKMIRVNKKKPCPVCGKPDWCLVSRDGSAAICQRISQQSVKKCGDAGWLHILSEGDRKGKWQNRSGVRISNDFGKTRDFETIAKLYQKRLGSERLKTLATSLGLSAESLKRLNAGWDGQAYTFPMADDLGTIIGIRRRLSNGHKVSVAGSKTGLFIPEGLPAKGLLLICEGITDTAAALDLGFAAIGRPNCNSKVRMTTKTARGREVIVIGDNDDVGKSGAEKLAKKLLLYCQNVKIIYPPEGIKDLRQWLGAGLTSKTFQGVIKETEPIEIRIRFKE